MFLHVLRAITSLVVDLAVLQCWMLQHWHRRQSLCRILYLRGSVQKDDCGSTSTRVYSNLQLQCQCTEQT